MPKNLLWRARWAAIAAVAVAALGLSIASAQFGPPSTVFGSVTDSAGPIAENLKVEAYIGDTLCGTGSTQYVGEGSSKVTVYYADVVEKGQTAGCGESGKEVRVKIGDRFADETFKWEQGPVKLDITFGSATPAPIPTFTPTPTRNPQQVAAAGNNSTPVPGSENSGNNAQASGGQGGDGQDGGVSSSSNVQSESEDDGGGFPVWGIALLVLGALAVIGGTVGFVMSRNRPDDDVFPPRAPQ